MSCSEGQHLLKFFISTSVQKFKKVLKVAFSEKYLLLTNLGISVSLSGLGDTIEQRYEIMTGELDEWNPSRTANMSASGLTVGFVCHHWYRYLDKFLPGYTLRIVMKKIMVDQFVGSPLCISTFFVTIGYLEGTGRDAFVEEVKQKAWKLYAAEWVIWPPAQFINFYLLPNKFRVLFDNSISLGYDIYTSRIKHVDEKLELETKDRSSLDECEGSTSETRGSKVDSLGAVRARIELDDVDEVSLCVVPVGVQSAEVILGRTFTEDESLAYVRQGDILTFFW